MRCVRAVLAVALMAAPSVVVGASSNCSNSCTGIEESICAGKVLLRLDEQLAKGYDESVFLLSANENRLDQLAAAKQTGWKTFRDNRLGIEFSYPSSRKVKVGCRGSKNCIALIGKPMPNSDYIIAFEVFDGGLETVAVEQAVFEKKNPGWIARGRFGEHPAVPLVGSDWQGLKSIVDCGISDSNGFHAGAGECMWVVLSNGKRSVVVDTQGLVGIDEASMRSIQSIRFSKQR
jgi:uncharacterized protein YecT (DUF1311 family)